MESDSSAVPLPLAEAVLAWSRRDLLDAVRAAEQACKPGELDRWQRDTLASLETPRTKPRRGRILSLAERGPVAFDRAWENLVDGFRGLIAAGDIHLFGVQTHPVPGTERVVISAAWAPLMDFDLGGNAVFTTDRSFALVTASVAPPAIIVGEAASVGPFPLGQAITRWTAPALVEAVRTEERRLSEHELSMISDRPRLSAVHQLRQPTPNDWMLGGPDLHRLTAAWEALERDFKARLISGTLTMTGVQMTPVRQVQHTLIPGVWAADCRMDLLNSTVSVGETRYVAVVVGPAGVATRAPEVAAQAEASATAPGVVQAQRRNGRKGAAPEIEAAVRRHWQQVRQLMAPEGGPPVRTEVARSFHKLMEADARTGICKRRWKGETVRKHLPEIYERVLGEKAHEEQSAQ